MDEILGMIRNRASQAKDSAERIAKEVAKRTSNAITHTKLSFSMNETQSKIKDIYSEIGKEIYANHIDGKDCGDAFETAFAQLDELHEEVEVLMTKIAQLKESVKCEECGAMNSKDAEYCSKCGSSMSAKPAVEEEEEAIADNDPTPNMVIADADEPIIIATPKPE